MALKTKSIYDRREKEDGTRVLITRFYPRGIKKGHFDRWVRELSPSRELLRDYKLGRKNWEDFRSEFIAELARDPSVLPALGALREESRKADVTLLCYERSGVPCHRYVVAEAIDDPRVLERKRPKAAAEDKGQEKERIARRLSLRSQARRDRS